MEDKIVSIHHYDCFGCHLKNKKNIPGDADPVDFLIGLTWMIKQTCGSVPKGLQSSG